MKWPASSAELLDQIEKMVPERLPEPGETMEAYNQHVGARRLVLQLKHARDEAKRAAARATEGKPRVRR